MKRIGTAFFFIFNLFAALVHSQTLTVNSNQLNFGTAFENAPDSLQLTLTNNLGRTITVTGIKFYNTYGIPAFSASSSWFTIADAASETIWIKFSPRHNILHNSEMIIENDGLRGFINVDLVGQGKYSNSYYDPTENFSEQNLKNIINLITGNGYQSLGYAIARDSMFMNFDNKRRNGQGASQNTIECVYTGREAIGYTDRTDCQTNYSFNTEHTFPQSLFTSMEPMRSDLHHLFPTDDAANSERGDNPFAIVTSPSWSNGGSLSDGVKFEPRDEQKGNVARALFYFVLRYQNYSNFLDSQEAELRNWHIMFPPSSIDRNRNNDIFAIQHNRNPFVDYPVFIERITSVSANSVEPLISSIDLTQDTINFGTVQPGTPVIFNYVVVNNGNTNVNITNFNLTHSAELSFSSSGNDTVLSPGESLPVQIQCMTTATDSIRAFLTFSTSATGHSFVMIPIFVNDLIFSGIDENDFPGLTISPNPAHDRVRITLDGLKEALKCEIFDMMGKRIASSIINRSGEIELSGIDKGIYLFRVMGHNEFATRKIIVE